MGAAGHRAEGKEGKPLMIDKAVELLCKLDSSTPRSRKASTRGEARGHRVGVRFARTARLVKVRPLSRGV